MGGGGEKCKFMSTMSAKRICQLLAAVELCRLWPTSAARSIPAPFWSAVPSASDQLDQSWPEVGAGDRVECNIIYSFITPEASSFQPAVGSNQHVAAARRPPPPDRFQGRGFCCGLSSEANWLETLRGISSSRFKGAELGTENTVFWFPLEQTLGLLERSNIQHVDDELIQLPIPRKSNSNSATRARPEAIWPPPRGQDKDGQGRRHVATGNMDSILHLIDFHGNSE